MNGWLCPDAVFHDGRVRTDLSVHVQDGVVIAVGHEGAGRPVRGTLSPRLVDLQVNGGGGVLFNADPTPEGIAAILAAHRRAGTGWILPTLITDAPEVMDRAADAILCAWGTEGLLGLHLEGPHIDPRKRGTHAARHIRLFDARTRAVLHRLRKADIPVLLTVAPEAMPEGAIADLVAMGVTVSLGHSAADAVIVRAALDQGATAFTHLFNAMSPMEGRAPGMTGTAILSGVHVGLICDGIHVADDMIALALQARRGPTFLVSDAMPTVGGPDRFTLYGRTITLRNGRLVNDDGALAGAHTTMAEGVTRLCRSIGLPLEEALRMAITHPAAAIGVPEPRVVGTRLDDLVLWDDAGTMRPLP